MLFAFLCSPLQYPNNRIEKRQMRYLLALLCTGLWSVSSNAEALQIEAYGDSLTAGFLSGTQVTSPPPLQDISDILTDMATSFRLKDRSGLARHHYPKLAWPQQVVNDLRAKGVDAQLRNYAVSGSRSYDLLAQIKKNTQSGKTVAFFFIGHNDLCDQYNSTSDMTFNYKLGVKDALKEWARRHKNSEAFILPVGKVDEVFSLLAGYKWKRGKNHDFTCDQNWERNFPYCRAHFKKYKAGTLDAFLKERIRGLNDTLRDIVDELAKEDTKNSYVLLKDTHGVSYGKEHFAIDCYHLSSEGQESLAGRVLAEADKLSTAGLK